MYGLHKLAVLNHACKILSLKLTTTSRAPMHLEESAKCILIHGDAQARVQGMIGLI